MYVHFSKYCNSRSVHTYKYKYINNKYLNAFISTESGRGLKKIAVGAKESLRKFSKCRFSNFCRQK